MKENTMATNFDSHECVIFCQSTKIGTHENKAIHSSDITTVLFKKLGHIALHILVGCLVSLQDFVQLITEECVAPQASNLVGR